MNKKIQSDAVNKQEDEDFSVYPLYYSTEKVYAMRNEDGESAKKNAGVSEPDSKRESR